MSLHRTCRPQSDMSDFHIVHTVSCSLLPTSQDHNLFTNLASDYNPQWCADFDNEPARVCIIYRTEEWL